MQATARPVCSLPTVLAAPGDPALEDDALVLQVQAGDRGALEELVRRYRGRVYTFLLAMTRRPEDAEDLAQETFASAIRALPQYRARGHFRAWLFAIAVNAYRAHQRHARRGPELLQHEPECAVPESPDPQDVLATRSAVRSAIARLPEYYRAPVVLFYLEDLPVAEVAKVLGRSAAAVKVQLWRARGILARELAGWIE